MIGEMARSYNASSAVSSGSSKHHNPLLSPVRAETFKCHLCKVAPGVFHHLKKIGARFLRCDSVDLPHLVGCDGGDCNARWSPKSQRRFTRWLGAGHRLATSFLFRNGTTT